jgi:hypothetical protein
MSTPPPSISELAAQLQQALEAARAENEQLAKQINEFEGRAEAAESRAREAEEKLRILESLKTREYQTVVTELFEGPSRRAARLTLVVAVLSIAIGLAQTIVSSIYAARANSAAVSRFSTSLRAGIANDTDRSAHQSKRNVGVITPSIPHDGSTDSRAIVLAAGLSVKGFVENKQRRFYQIEVPQGAPALNVILTCTGPAHAHIHVGLQGAQWRAPESEIFSKSHFLHRYISNTECLNGHVGSTDSCTFDNPQPGQWRIEVVGFYPSTFQLAADFVNRPRKFRR